MKKLIFALLLVAVLLSLFASVAFATCPEYEDPNPPGVNQANANGVLHMKCVKVPSTAVDHAGFEQNDCPVVP